MPLVLLLVLIACLPCCAQPKMPLEFESDPGWEARPTYLPNPADSPDIVATDGAVALRVDESGQGMKFQLDVRPFDSGAATYLLFRYQARNLAKGYAIWVYDESDGGRQILGIADLIQDGEWHIAAIDLSASGVVGAIRAVVSEVQCTGQPASLTIDYLRLSDELPQGVVALPKEAPVTQEIVVRPGQLEGLQPEPEWLGQPADVFGADVEEGILHLYAEGESKGMKWSVPLPQTVDTGEYRFAAVRYRAVGAGTGWDYFVWLGSEAGGRPPQSENVISLSRVRADGTWQVAVAQISEAFTASNMALQVVSSTTRADVWIDSIRFSNNRPLVDAADLAPVRMGWGDSLLPTGSFEAVDLAGQANTSATRRLKAFGLKSWFPAGRMTVRGIPFELPRAERDVIATPSDIDQVARIQIDARAREAYLLLAARLPSTDSARMGRPVSMDGFSNPERFLLRVSYSDGIVDEMFPVRVSAGAYEVARGIELYCLTGLRDRAVRDIELVNRMSSASFLVAGVTLNQGEAVTPRPFVAGLPPASAARSESPGSDRIVPVTNGYFVENDLIRLHLRTAGGISLRSVDNRCLQGAEMQVRPAPLFEVGVGQTTVTSEQVTVGMAAVHAKKGQTTLAVPFNATARGVPITGELRVTVGGGPDVQMHLDLLNAGEEVIIPSVSFPTMSGIRLGSAEDTWYLYGRKGGIISNLPTHQRNAYGGEYPIQVMDAFNPAAGGGLALLTYDLEDIYRFWDLRKDDGGLHWSMDYWEREHQPGERIQVAPTALRAHSGDWRRALEIYRAWAHSWYRPQVARKDWFQRVFYYQQTTAWGTLRDRETGQWRMKETIERYREYFGRLDYLHIFDFGQSMQYGRVGDYSHYDELGGLQAMRGAIKQAQDMAVPIGLYIEGYLCDDRGVWGQDNAGKYDIRKADLSPLLWDGAPTEHMMCPAAKGWRDHLSNTYRRVAGELKPNGMYIDQYGFINVWKTCHSREHGHPVPWAPIRGERDTTRAIRAAIPKSIANLTEETPNDVNSQYQDGGLGYSVTQTDPRLAPHRADLFRFVFPSFKVFQLVQYNSYLQGAWQLLKYPFFNGEGLWLHGGTHGTYCEDAHQFLRKTFAILNRYEDAFCSRDVQALVPTLQPTLYANEFRGGAHTVWTLFNAEYRTFRGPCLRVAHRPGTQYIDAFTGEPVRAVVNKGSATVTCEVGPRGVGCIVATGR